MYDNAPTGQYAPLSPWAYWGLTLLFSIPVLGLVFLIIFSFSSANINRRNFARSYWIGLLLALIVIGVFLLIAFLTGGIETIMSNFR